VDENACCEAVNGVGNMLKVVIWGSGSSGFLDERVAGQGQLAVLDRTGYALSAKTVMRISLGSA